MTRMGKIFRNFCLERDIKMGKHSNWLEVELGSILLSPNSISRRTKDTKIFLKTFLPLAHLLLKCGSPLQSQIKLAGNVLLFELLNLLLFAIYKKCNCSYLKLN